MSEDQPETKKIEYITEAQRSGSLTGIGIVLGFSLTFTGQWSFASGDWTLPQVGALAILGIGIVLQLLSLFRVLSLPPIQAKDHRRVETLFAWGVCLVLIGIAAHISLSFPLDILKCRLS